MSEIICSFQIGSSILETISVDAYLNQISISQSNVEIWFDIADVTLLRETIENISEGEYIEPNLSNGQSIKIFKDSECVLISSLSEWKSIAVDNNSISEFCNDFRDYLGA